MRCWRATAAARSRCGAATRTDGEVAWLIRHEFARSAEDVAWRRTKLGLHLSLVEMDRLDAWIAEQRKSGSTDGARLAG